MSPRLALCLRFSHFLFPSDWVTGAAHQAQLRSIISQSILIMWPLEELAQLLGTDFLE